MEQSGIQYLMRFCVAPGRYGNEAGVCTARAMQLLSAA